MYSYTVCSPYYIGSKQCTPTKGLLHYIGDKQCRGTLIGPYSASHAAACKPPAYLSWIHPWTILSSIGYSFSLIYSILLIVVVFLEGGSIPHFLKFFLRILLISERANLWVPFEGRNNSRAGTIKHFHAHMHTVLAGRTNVKSTCDCYKST